LLVQAQLKPDLIMVGIIMADTTTTADTIIMEGITIMAITMAITIMDTIHDHIIVGFTAAPITFMAGDLPNSM
jgi:hypothetical protein